MTWLLFQIPPFQRWWNTLPIPFWRILLVSTIPHAKYTRMVCFYITSSSRYVNPACTYTIIELFTNSYLLCEGYYNMYMFRSSAWNIGSITLGFFALTLTWNELCFENSQVNHFFKNLVGTKNCYISATETNVR